MLSHTETLLRLLSFVTESSISPNLYPKGDFVIRSGDDLYLKATCAALAPPISTAVTTFHSIPAAEGLSEALDLYVLTVGAEQDNAKHFDDALPSNGDSPRKEGKVRGLTCFSMRSDPEAGIVSFDHNKTVWGTIRKKSELIGQAIGELDLDTRFDLQVEKRQGVSKCKTTHTGAGFQALVQKTHAKR